MPEQLQVTVEKLVYGGHGLSRDNGRVVLTPLVLPGEQITVENVDKLHARLVHLDTAAPERVRAPCPYFGDCGGCHYQHMPYAMQTEQKAAILHEVLRRVGKLDAPDPIRIIAGEPWHYRNRTQLHVREGRIGYLRMGSHDLCPIDHCPISAPEINKAIQALVSLVQDRRWPGFIRRIELFTNGTDLQFNVLDSGQPVARHFFEWVSERLPGYAPGSISCATGQGQFRVSPRSFFQVNRFLIDPLVEAAIEGTSGESAIDLYAGVGLFSKPLAIRFGQLTAIEAGASGVSDLKVNVPEARAVRASVDEYLTSVTDTPDFILADPPREGLGKAVVRELIRIAPKRLHIVACDPATLARDLRHLLENGYTLERIAMADLFPQTYHLETIAYCVRDA